MFSVSTVHSVSWPQPTGTAVAPVAGVEAVRPIQKGQRGGQSGADAGAEDQPPGGVRRDPSKTTTDHERVPLLPRKAAAGTDFSDKAGATTRARGEAVAQREAQQAEAQAQAEKAAEKTRRERLQTVLTEVWKASAAVVDRVLGRDPAQPPTGGAEAAIGAASPFAANLSGQDTPAIEPLAWPVMRETEGAKGWGAQTHPVQEVVAYDERGNSSLAPLETGVLIDRTV